MIILLSLCQNLEDLIGFLDLVDVVHVGSLNSRQERDPRAGIARLLLPCRDSCRGAISALVACNSSLRRRGGSIGDAEDGVVVVGGSEVSHCGF